MSKAIVRPLLFALVGVFALDLRAAPTWTTGSCAPASWTVLANNLLAGQTGMISGTIATGYSTNDPDLLTDGEVPPVGDANTVKTYIVGFQNNAYVTWTFASPKTLEGVRISCGYPVAYQNYAGFTVSSVEIQTFGNSTWTALNTTAGQVADNGQNEIQWLTLADESGGPLAEAVGALRVTFATPPAGYANYCAEIEAVGSAGALGPAIGTFAIAPAKTKATVSGLIADAGTDATTCDVYFSIDDAETVKIAEGVTGSFAYQIQGLAAGTAYAYELSVSNNAPTVKGTVRTGTFTTLAADASTAFWTAGDIAPEEWTALPDNLLSGMAGMVGGAIVGSSYGTNDTAVLTDLFVPTTGGANYIVGFQNNSSITWTFDKPRTLERVRVSACYLAGQYYTRLAITGVSVRLASSDEWTALDAPAFSDISGKSQNVIILATLSDCETGVLAQNVAALKIAFGNVGALASYVAEIEAVGFAEEKKVAPAVLVR